MNASLVWDEVRLGHMFLCAWQCDQDQNICWGTAVFCGTKYACMPWLEADAGGQACDLVLKETKPCEGSSEADGEQPKEHRGCVIWTVTLQESWQQCGVQDCEMSSWCFPKVQQRKMAWCCFCFQGPNGEPAPKPAVAVWQSLQLRRDVKVGLSKLL